MSQSSKMLYIFILLTVFPVSYSQLLAVENENEISTNYTKGISFLTLFQEINTIKEENLSDWESVELKYMHRITENIYAGGSIGFTSMQFTTEFTYNNLPDSISVKDFYSINVYFKQYLANPNSLTGYISAASGISLEQINEDIIFNVNSVNVGLNIPVYDNFKLNTDLGLIFTLSKQLYLIPKISIEMIYVF